MAGLDGTAISGTGFKHLEALGNLKHVTLTQAPVTDAGLEQISALASIEMLRLGSYGGTPKARLTDKGLIHLHKLPRLRLVALRGLPITRAAIDALKTARPKLVVDGP